MELIDWTRITEAGLYPAARLCGGIEQDPADPNPKEVTAARGWIKWFAEPTKGIRTRYSSYGLKHVVEEWSGHYVSNGAFIRAAELEGYRIKRASPESPNAFFNMLVRRPPERRRV